MRKLSLHEKIELLLKEAHMSSGDAESKLRSLRQDVWNYPEGSSGEQVIQAQIERAKKSLFRARNREAARKLKEIFAAPATPKQPKAGPFSGLTRDELRKSGTCETDWY